MPGIRKSPRAGAPTVRPLARAISTVLLGGTLLAPAIQAAPWLAETELPASNILADDNLGVSASISGDYLVVGASTATSGGRAAAGAAFVFERDAGGNWLQVARLSAHDAMISDQLGYSVSVSGDVALLGAWADDDKGSSSGSAYLFERDGGGVWRSVSKLVPADGAQNDNFGKSVAISGDTAMIGVPFDDNSGRDSGSVYVYQRDVNNVWRLVARLSTIDADWNDNFGISLAIDGDTAVIGAQGNDDAGSGSGSAYVFSRNQAGAWSQVTKLTQSDGAAFDLFGQSVAISGDTVVVGSFQDDDQGADSGSAYVFTRDGAGVWSQTAKLVASDGAAGDSFGWSVAVSGDNVVVGARYDDDQGGSSGSAYVFTRDGAGDWSQTRKLTPSNGAASRLFGQSVALAGDAAVIGAPGAAPLPAAYVYEDGANITLVKTHDAELGLDASTHYAAPGDTLTYTISATNDDGAAIGNVAISDSLPAGLSFVSAESPDCAHEAGTVVCSIDELAADGGSVSLNVETQVTAQAGAVISNTALVSVSGQEVERDSVDVTINTPPVADGITGASAIVVQVNSQTYSGSLTGSDADTDAIEFSMGGSDPALGSVEIDPAGNFTYLPDSMTFGDDSFSFRVDDGKQYSAEATVEITIDHQPPSIDPIDDQQVDEDNSSESLSLVLSDDATPVYQIELAATSDNPTLVPNDSQHLQIASLKAAPGRLLTITPAADRSGTATITVTADDGDKQASISFNFTVVEINDPPVISGQNDVGTDEDTAFAITLDSLQISDPDNSFPDDFSLTVGDGADYSRDGSTITPAPNFNGMLSVPVTVNDGEFESAPFNLQLSVRAVNDAPQITSAEPPSATQGTPFSHTVTATDPDEGQTLAITAPTLPDWLTLTDNGDGTATLASKAGRPDDGDAGSHAVLLRVSDDAEPAGSADQAFDLVVADVNDLPTIGDIRDQQIDEDSVTSALSFSVADNEIAAADLQVTASSSNPDLVPNEAANLLLSGTDGERALVVTPAPDQHGSTDITLTVSDGTLSASTSFTLTVDPVEDAPVFTSAAVTSAMENAPYSYAISAEDADAGQQLSITAVGDLPAGLTLVDNGGGSAALSGVPTEVGSHPITLQVSDDASPALSSTQSFTLEVGNVNDAPSFTSKPVTEATEDADYRYAISASDPDAGQSLSFTAVGALPAGLALSDNGDGTASLAGAPSVPGDHEVTLVVADDASPSLSDTQRFTLSVANVNDAPSLSGTPPTRAVQGVAYSFAPVAADDDGDSLSFAISGKPGWASFDSANGALSGVPGEADVGSHGGIVISVSDGNGGSASLPAFAIEVANSNDAPIATSASASVAEDGSVSFTPSVTDPDLGDSHRFSLLGQPSHGTAAVTASGELRYTPNADFNGSDSFAFRAIDSGDAYVDGSAQITVTPVNDAPSLSAAANGLVLKVGDTLRVTLNGSDVDGDSLSFAAASDYGSVSFDGSTLGFTASAETPAGGATLTVTASDGSGGEASVSLPLTVNPADAVDSNGDGISDAQAIALGLDPNAANGDSDGDGIPDAVEIGDPANASDSDGDGIIDALESGADARNVSSLSFQVPASTAESLGMPGLSGDPISLSAAGGQTITAHVNGDTGLPLLSEADAATAGNTTEDGQYSFPIGLFSFSVTTGGAPTATVTLNYGAEHEIPAGAVVRKLTLAGDWQTYPADKVVIDRDAGTITLTLVDNDGVFDLDPAAGVIRDPVGVAKSDSSDDSTSGWGGSASSSPLALFTLMALLAVLRLRRR